MKEKINLEEILEKHRQKFLKESVRFVDYQLNAMKEACQQVLELAAENARIIDDPNSYCGNTGSEYPPDQIVSKQSILDTIKQVE
jgi:hypothetical protein